MFTPQNAPVSGFAFNDHDLSPHDELFPSQEPRYHHSRHASHGDFAHYSGYYDSTPTRLDTTHGDPYYYSNESVMPVPGYRDDGRHYSTASDSPRSRCDSGETSPLGRYAQISNTASGRRRPERPSFRLTSGRHSHMQSTTKPHCAHDDCKGPDGQPTRFFSRKADVNRHMKSQHEPKYIDCPKNRCLRKGQSGFTRNDHLLEHLRQYHNETIEKRGTTTGARRPGNSRHT